MSKLFTLRRNDYVRGLVVAVLSAVLTWLLQVLEVPGFDFASISLSECLRIALVAAIAYLAKNFATDDNGKVIGKI